MYIIMLVHMYIVHNIHMHNARTHTHTLEFIVYDHNSPIMEQRERNRNIPHTSVRRNNYSGLWDDDYRDRCFDEVGYRNLVCERLQRYERSQWAAEGGTGIVTGCVRDMTRRQAILDREEQDLAFEVRV